MKIDLNDLLGNHRGAEVLRVVREHRETGKTVYLVKCSFCENTFERKRSNIQGSIHSMRRMRCKNCIRVYHKEYSNVINAAFEKW